jgi:nitroreductase/NAD-dependent dihydropyrimidine dehydrogenase PreA subunit
MNDTTIENQVELREIVDFKVDSSACVKCGACVRDCAFKVLSVDDNSLPAMPHPEKCMRCQHCFAICPTGAITFDGVKSSDAMEVKGLSLPNAEQVSNWIKSRRSIRKFQPDDVDPAVLDKVLKLLANSPTGCNARSLTFTCYPNRAAVDEFRSAFLKAVEEHRDGAKLLPRWLAIPAIKLRKGGEDIFFRGASGILIVSSDETASGVTTPMEDVTIACSNFELIANANGIGTCWCGFLKLVQNEIPELLEKAAGIRRTTPFYAILFGRSAVKYARCAERGAYASIVYKHPKGSD